MLLVAFGVQDLYLTGSPQITYFKVVYRRYTNFAMESIEQTFTGATDFGRKMVCTVSRNGDLLHKVYLRVELPTVTVLENSSFRWLNWVGHILLKSAEIDIGGSRIDKHYGDWLHMWNELTQTAGHQLGYANMVGNIPQLTNPVQTGAGEEATVAGETLYIPLEFWFCRNPGLALPLIALQYHEVKLTLELSDKKDCYWAADVGTDGSGNTTYTYNASRAQFDGGLKSASLYADYVYLDTDERRRFAQMSHEYLIEQLQFSGDESTSTTNTRLKLTFNHPVKALYWNIQPDTHSSHEDASFGKQPFNYTDAVDRSYESDPNLERSGRTGAMSGIAAGGANGVFIPVSFAGGKNPLVEGKLQLNGHDRTSERDGRYYNLVQPYQHHENVPALGINMYSFALKPEEHQPSGTCNFSRIDNAVLHMKLTPASVDNHTARIRVYALSYNVLRIMAGMGGMAFSN